ncbi:MAG: hypothetical protein ACFCU2_08625 [Acidimicrobiia bacterium]
MFVEHEIAVEIPIAVVERQLIDKLSALEGFGEVVYRRGEELRSRVGPETPLAKEVALKFGHPKITRSGLALPFTWRATGARSLFPRLTGDLEASRSGPSGATLRVRASYDPPFGWVGDVLDHLLLERVARLTIEDWLQRVGTSLANAPPISYPE